MLIAMLYGWEIALAVGVVIVLLSVRRGFQPDPTRFNGKRAWFYFLMTAGALVIGCLLGLIIVKLGER